MMSLFAEKEPLLTDKEFEDYVNKVIKQEPIKAIKTSTGGIGVNFGETRVYLSGEAYGTIGYYEAEDLSKAQKKYLHKKVKEAIQHCPTKYA